MSTTSIKAQGLSLDAAPVNVADELGLDFAESDSEEEREGGGSSDEADEDHRHDEGAEADPADNEIAEQDDVKPKKKPFNDTRWQELEDILGQIERYEKQPPDQHSFTSDSDPQYLLLTRANTFSTTIDDNTVDLNKRLRDLYSTRFPELETLLPDPLEYARTTAILANGPMTQDSLRDIVSSPSNVIGTPLTAVLSRPKLMSVTVEATTSKGKALTDAQLEAAQSTAQKMLKLESAKRTITLFVESRMTLFCPNLTALVGSQTGAELLTARSGLTGLAQTRAANLPGVGSKRFAASGLATGSGVRNQGILFNSDIIRSIRQDFRVQGMRILSAKVILAARIDLARSDPSGAEGQKLYDQVQGRIEKLSEAAPNKGQRALPAPDDKPSKKRGGRKARKAKEATAMTDLRKAQNRMKFGEEEKETGYGTGDTTKGMGMIGQQDDGRIRAMQVDSKTRAKLSKRNAGWNVGGGTGTNMMTSSSGAASSLRSTGQSGTASVLRGHGLRASGVATNIGTGTAGTASSLAFNQRQGLELIDPKVRAEMEKKDKANEDKWFRGGTFTQVNSGRSVANGQPNGGEDGFKKPALPAKRKVDDAS